MLCDSRGKEDKNDSCNGCTDAPADRIGCSEDAHSQADQPLSDRWVNDVTTIGRKPRVVTRDKHRVVILRPASLIAQSHQGIGVFHVVGLIEDQSLNCSKTRKPYERRHKRRQKSRYPAGLRRHRETRPPGNGDGLPFASRSFGSGISLFVVC